MEKTKQMNNVQPTTISCALIVQLEKCCCIHTRLEHGLWSLIEFEAQLLHLLDVQLWAN